MIRIIIRMEASESSSKTSPMSTTNSAAKSGTAKADWMSLEPGIMARTIGRFMTPDWAAKPTDVPYAHYGNPQSLNLYSYVQNNPTTVGDPDGHQSPDMVLDNPEVGRIIDNAIGIVVGVATAAYVDSKGWIKDAVDGYGVGVGDDSMIGTDPVFDRNYFLSKNSNASNTNTQSGSATDKGPVKAKDAPESAGGQATNEHGQKLGPNGKPQVNNVNKNTREKAKNAANKGSGTIEDTNPKRGDPHFHTKRGDGTKKRDNVHYNYPEVSFDGTNLDCNYRGPSGSW